MGVASAVEHIKSTNKQSFGRGKQSKSREIKGKSKNNPKDPEV